MTFSVEQIMRFCALEEDDPRWYLQLPTVLGDAVIATNGHIMVSIPVSQCESIAEEWRDNDKLAKAVSNSPYSKPAFDKRVLVQLPDKVVCPTCHGSGMVPCEDEFAFDEDEDEDDEDEDDETELAMETCYRCRGVGQRHLSPTESDASTAEVRKVPLDMNYLDTVVGLLGNVLLVAAPPTIFEDGWSMWNPIYFSSTQHPDVFIVLMGIRAREGEAHVVCAEEVLG
ncbi:hypothetical protein [Thiolinea disciformis]|uniref:hypothetical protein n=1 Tax=Thiolinea disciformis TaxID=125614 RepID=UPI0003A688C6|nr:hypothetical protein [Thiolinea disciformis]